MATDDEDDDDDVDDGDADELTLMMTMVMMASMMMAMAILLAIIRVMMVMVDLVRIKNRWKKLHLQKKVAKGRIELSSLREWITSHSVFNVLFIG